MKRPIHPFWGFAEIILVFGGLQAFTWYLGPHVSGSGFLVAFTWLLWIFLGFYVVLISPVFLHKLPRQEAGWISPNNKLHHASIINAWKPYTIVTAIGVITLLIFTFYWNPDAFQTINLRGLAIKSAGYLFSGIIQAAIFFGFILVRFKAAISHLLKGKEPTLIMGLTIICTTVVFSLFHYPNPELMIFTFSAGLCWSLLFYLSPNILLMGLSHAILGTILHQIVQLHMRIGPFYNNPDLYVVREIIPGLKQLIGNLF